MKGQIGIVFLFIILGVIAYLFWSGLIQFPGAPTGRVKKGEGVTLSLDYELEVESQKTLTLKVNVSNDGDYDANDIFVKLYGLSGDWKVNEEPFPGTVIQTIEELKKGKSKLIRWKLRAPSELVEFTYPFTVQIEYPYLTTYKALIKVVSETYAEEEKEKGEIVEEAVTAGPLGVQMIAPTEGFISTDTIIPVEIRVKNIGGGILSYAKIEESRNIICPGINFREDLEFKKEVTVECDLKVGSVEKYINLPVNLTLSYTYFLESEGEIKVLPKD